MSQAKTSNCDCDDGLFARESSHRSANMLQQALAAIHLASRMGPGPLESAKRQLTGIVDVNHLLAGQSALVDLGQLLKELSGAVLRSHGADGVSLSVASTPILVDTGRIRPLLMAVAELVGNSTRHAFPEGRGQVQVAVHRVGEGLELLIEDDGTCTGWSRPGGQGRGVVDALVGRMGGSIERSTTAAGSSRTTISLPLLAAAATPAGEAA